MAASFESDEVFEEKNHVRVTEVELKSEPEPLFPPGYFRQENIKTSKKVAAIVIFISLITAFVTLVKYSVDEVKLRSLDSRFSYNSDITSVVDKPTTDADEIKVEIRVLSADLIYNRVQTHISFFPSSKFAYNRSRIREPILVYFGYYQKTFAANSTMSPIEVTFPILTGSTSYYPFDIFHTEIAVELTNLSTEDIIPVEVSLKAGVPSLQFDIDQTSQFNDGTQKTTEDLDVNSTTDKNDQASKYRFRIAITRPNTVIFFSMFVVILMWVLSSAIVGVTFNITFLSPYRPTAALLGVGSALLFAMPNLRNTQPGVPPIGIIIDSIGFFWNMVLVALSTVTILSTWIKRSPSRRILA